MSKFVEVIMKNNVFLFKLHLQQKAPSKPRLGVIHAMCGAILRPVKGLKHIGSGPQVLLHHTTKAQLRN